MNPYDLQSDDEPQHNICCGCGKYKDTGGVCECGVSHRELCEECRNTIEDIEEGRQQAQTDDLDNA